MAGVCVCVCMCVYMLCMGWPNPNPKVVGSIPSCGHHGIVGVSLNKKLYSHSSSPLSCNINGYPVITGEAKVKTAVHVF